jgi:hypothetical protein
MTQKNPGSLPLTTDFVSLTLKGRTDGFDLKGGDATQGKQMTMYSGPRPDRTIAGTCGGGNSGSATTVQLHQCVSGLSNQTWGFLKNGKSIASGPLCLDIDNYGTKQGSEIWAYPCGSGAVKENENWGLNGATITSLQPDTPFCVGTKGALLHPTATQELFLSFDLTPISPTRSPTAPLTHRKSHAHSLLRL